MPRNSPIIYLREARGGRQAAHTQERQVRAALAEVGISSEHMHVSCDLDVSGRSIGPALTLLLEEAQLGRIETVVVRDASRLGSRYEVLASVLMSLQGAGVDVLSTDDLAHDRGARERLRAAADRQGRAPRLTLGWGPTSTCGAR